MEIRILKKPIPLSEVVTLAKEQFGDMVKVVVDVERQILAIGGDLHSDEEAVLLEDGSQQEYLWGINIYPETKEEERIEFDSMINVRPSQNNRSRDVEDLAIRAKICGVVKIWIQS